MLLMFKKKELIKGKSTLYEGRGRLIITVSTHGWITD